MGLHFVKKEMHGKCMDIMIEDRAKFEKWGFYRVLGDKNDYTAIGRKFEKRGDILKEVSVIISKEMQAQLIPNVLLLPEPTQLLLLPEGKSEVEQPITQEKKGFNRFIHTIKKALKLSA